jgi:hypothetical protein
MSDLSQVARRMAGAAVAFLGALDADQRPVATWPFPADDERRRWFYTPTDHGGIVLGDLRPGQQRLAMQLVATGLSRAGFVTVSAIMGLENILDDLEGFTASWGFERGRDPARYYLRVFGDPASDSAWSWRFGGHHVSIQHVVVDGAVVASTPCFLGADPASAPLLGPHALRPLAGAEDLARDLVQSLDDTQRRSGIVSNVAPVDLVGGNRTRISDGDVPPPLADIWRGRFDGELGARVVQIQEQAERRAGLRPEHLDAVRLTPTPKGISASTLRPAQQQLLRRVLDVYVGRIPDELAEAEAAKYAGERLHALSFAWAGGTAAGEPHYYRIQGPRLLVEYDNTQRDANHVHSVWRDPEGDFGADLLSQHYRAAH